MSLSDFSGDWLRAFHFLEKGVALRNEYQYILICRDYGEGERDEKFMGYWFNVAVCGNCSRY